MLYLEDGKPLRFGNNNEHGIRLNGFNPEVVHDAEGDDGLLVHDAHEPKPNLANILVEMDYPEFPVPVGVFRDVDAPRYEELLQGQVEQARAKNPPDLAEMIRGPETWEVV
jgi:2-oxoglutarate ferredoxin oxidoreductase subunit beta